MARASLSESELWSSLGLFQELYYYKNLLPHFGFVGFVVVCSYCILLYDVNQFS